MTVMQQCPICGKENPRQSSTECVGTVEDYYNCDCGYFIYMSYCPRVTGVIIPEGISKEEFVAQHSRAIQTHGIQVFLPGEIELP